MLTHVLTIGLIGFTLSATASFAGPKHCPPGLAKKTPACVPPGQAKKGVSYNSGRDDDRYEDRDRHTDLRVGDRVILEGQDYIVVSAGNTVVLRRDDTLYRLPRIGDGSDYVRIGNVIVKVDRKTKAVFEVIELADLILS